MKNFCLAIVAAVASTLLMGCGSSPSAVNSAPTYPTDLSYPYIASEVRKSRIVSACSQIEPGMTLVEAYDIAGKPDVIRPLYEPQIMNPNQIGNTHWYFIQIDDPDNTTNASLMRLSTDSQDVITKVDHWGFDLQQENGR